MLPRQHPFSEEAIAISISKRMTKRSVIVPVSLCVLDMILTLFGQSSVYWDGEFQNLIEASPVFDGCLAIHPIVFVAAGCIWMGLFTTFVTTLPATLGRVVSTAVSIGHAVGSLAWLVRIIGERLGGIEHAYENSPSPVAYFAFILLIVLIAFLYSLLSNSTVGKKSADSKPLNSP